MVVSGFTTDREDLKAFIHVAREDYRNYEQYKHVLLLKFKRTLEVYRKKFQGVEKRL